VLAELYLGMLIVFSMKITKFKTISFSNTDDFDAELSIYVNAKWTLQGDPRTILNKDGEIEHFQTIKKLYDFSSATGKELFNQASQRVKEEEIH